MRVLQRIDEDVAEKLDYRPGVFTVKRHVRGKWVCAHCETLIQAPVAPHIIDKGVPTAGLLAQVLVAKYLDHLPLYRQEAIFNRAGLAIPRSTLAAWVGQCGAQLQPLVDVLRSEDAPESRAACGRDAGGHAQARQWQDTTGVPLELLHDGLRRAARRGGVFDFADSRGGQHARAFLGLAFEHGWRGTLVCDDFSGYKACFELGVTEAGCLAHARPKFHELWVNHGSQVGEQALTFFGELYDIERDVTALAAEERKRICRERSRKVTDALHQWLTAQRQKVPEGSATAKAIDYSLMRWQALTRYIADGDLPADNNRKSRSVAPGAMSGTPVSARHLR